LAFLFHVGLLVGFNIVLFTKFIMWDDAWVASTCKCKILFLLLLILTRKGLKNLGFNCFTWGLKLQQHNFFLQRYIIFFLLGL